MAARKNKARSTEPTAASDASTGENAGATAPPEPSAILQCPPELGPVARQEWDRVVPYLVETGELTVLDLMPLAIYCAAARDWLQSNEVIQKVGTVMKSPSGFPVQSPYVSIANRSAEVMLKILLEFKFTTASRGRRSTDEPSSSSGLLELKPLDVSKW